jgi:rhodanese-related sulfurtransferase
MTKIRSLLTHGALIVLVAYAVAQGLRVGADWFQQNPMMPLSFGELFPDNAIRSTNGRALIIATSDQCPHSLRSVTFHHDLIARARKLGLKIFVVSSQKSGIPKQIVPLFHEPDEIKVGAARSFRIVATPTIVLLDSGTVRGIWVGWLDQPQEEGLWRSVEGKAHTLVRAHRLDDRQSAATNFSERELNAWLNEAVVVDLQDRARFGARHLQGALNIPKDEFAARFEIEIDRNTKKVVLDCSSVSFGSCLLLGDMLTYKKYTNVWLLDQGSNGGSCHRSNT